MTRDERAIDGAYETMVKAYEGGAFSGTFANQLDEAADFMRAYLATQGVVRAVRWTTAEKVAGGVRVEFEFCPEIAADRRASVFK